MQLHTHSAGNSTRLRMMCPGAGSPLARGRACEAAGSEPAASAVEGRHAYTMQRRERGADERGADERGADARGADARGADERGADARGAGELDNDERGADARGAGERAMPKSAMAYGVAALPHQHGNVSQAMRGWEARLTAGIRARCTQWVSARQSYLTTSTCLLGLAGGQVRLALPSCAQGRRWLGAATAGDTRDAAGLCAQRQRVRLTARTPIVVGKLPRSRSGW